MQYQRLTVTRRVGSTYLTILRRISCSRRRSGSCSKSGLPRRLVERQCLDDLGRQNRFLPLIRLSTPRFSYLRLVDAIQRVVCIGLESQLWMTFPLMQHRLKLRQKASTYNAIRRQSAAYPNCLRSYGSPRNRRMCSGYQSSFLCIWESSASSGAYLFVSVDLIPLSRNSNQVLCRRSMSC
jgi:hypothetical protein